MKCLVTCCGIFLTAGWLWAEEATEPKLVSLFPFAGQCGRTFSTTVRGTGLKGASAVFFKDAPFTATVENVETDSTETKKPIDVVRVRLQIEPAAKPGRYPIRLITARGVSNGLPITVLDQALQDEPAGLHETPETAISVEKFPAIYNGSIARRGESDYYAFDAKAGSSVTFEVISGLPSTGAPGGNANGFDPSITLYEPSGSWFDPKRLNRIAFNDEPLWTIGGPTDARLVHRFEKNGRYFIRVEAFSGQGGPDYGYQLKMLVGDQPKQNQLPAAGNWKERAFVRRLSADRLNELAERGGKAQDQPKIETYGEASVFKVPGVLEGALTKPGEAHRARFHLDGPQDIAIEVQTPELAPPLFNPIVRLLDATGQEVATNIFAGRGLCTGEMTKMLQAKVIVPLRDAGDYTLEIRDTTSDLADPGFRYRVLVRAQIAHIGDVNIQEDHINIVPGQAKTVRVAFDREEGFRGAVAVTAEGLPDGVQALAGADFEPGKDPPRFPGKRERYVPRTERVVVAFTAASDAKLTEAPQLTRILVRPIVDGKPGAILSRKEIPIMVVAKP